MAYGLWLMDFWLSAFGFRLSAFGFRLSACKPPLPGEVPRSGGEGKNAKKSKK